MKVNILLYFFRDFTSGFYGSDTSDSTGFLDFSLELLTGDFSLVTPVEL